MAIQCYRGKDGKDDKERGLTLNDIPKMTPELFTELVGNVQPVHIHGFVPQTPGVRQDHKDDEPVQKPDEFMQHDLTTVPLTWFSLAPMYNALGPEFNLLADFSNSTEGRDAQVAAFQVDYPIFPTLEFGKNVIEGIDSDHFEYLRMFLAQTGFTKNGKWWLVTENTFEIKQPKFEKPFKLRVYTPVSYDVGVYSYQDLSNGTINFYQGGGNPLVEKYAQIYNVNVRKDLTA